MHKLIERIRWIENHLTVALHDENEVLTQLSPILNDQEMDEVKRAFSPIEKKCILNCEMECRMKLGKSLVYRNNLQRGQKINEDDICAKVNEPFGISAEYYEDFIGKILQNDVNAEENVDEKHFH